MSSTPNDVLAEARKNLQQLIDSGISKDLLHQLVDSSQSLQLGLGIPQQQQQTQSSIVSPLAPSSAPTSLQQMQSLPADGSAPTSTDHAHAGSLSPRDMRSQWNQPTNTNGYLAPVVEDAAAQHSSMFIPPNADFSHRPKISVSSTSSGSSGHASLWSNASGHSSASWMSATSSPASRAQAPLPMLPDGASSSPSLANMNPSIASSASSTVSASSTINRQNIYWCTSCETSFKRKYDWKRHEDEFHERWRKYPCPEPGCNRSFWGSNSFNQHHKQCHGCKTCPHAEKIVKYLRKRKYWACGFCSALHPARERHVEHVARHFESGLTKGDWMHSRVVYGLLHQPLIHEAWDALVQSKQPAYAGRRPQFSWHPSKTGRAQGFMENESAGQLQDLLEFFSGDEAEAQWITNIAYDLADIVLTMTPVAVPQYTQASMTQQQGSFSTASNPRLSFNTLNSHPQQTMMGSMESMNRNTMNQYQQPIFVPSQGFSQTQAQQSSPDSTSQSSIATPHSSLLSATQAQPPSEKGDVSQISSHGATGSDGLMDFEYSPAPVVFEDWESMSGAMLDDGSSLTAPGDWTNIQFVNDAPKMLS